MLETLLLVLVLPQVVQRRILLELHVLRILQRSFKNWKKERSRGNLMLLQHELQPKQQLQVLVVVVVVAAVSLAQKHMLQNLQIRFKRKDRNPTDRLQDCRQFQAVAEAVAGEKEEKEEETENEEVTIAGLAVELVLVAGVVIEVNFLITGKGIVVDEADEAVAVAAGTVAKVRKLLLVLPHQHLLVLCQRLVRMLCPRRKFPIHLICLELSKQIKIIRLI